MDGPVFASGKSKFRCGRVQPCVRPRPAAHMWARALMKSADWIPITSMRTKRLARKGCPNPRFDRCVINTQSSCKPLREDMPPMWIGITQPPLRRIASGSARPRRCSRRPEWNSNICSSGFAGPALVNLNTHFISCGLVSLSASDVIAR